MNIPPNPDRRMREPLSEAARKALEQAQHEARSLNQEFVGTEHLLLALIETHGTVTSRLLRQYHVDKEALRTQIRSTLPFSEQPPLITGALPLSPKAQRIVQNALVMARSLREPSVSTRLLLLAILEDARGTILQGLKDGGVDCEELLRSLGTKPEEPEA